MLFQRIAQFRRTFLNNHSEVFEREATFRVNDTDVAYRKSKLSMQEGEIPKQDERNQIVYIIILTFYTDFFFLALLLLIW